MRFFSTNNKRSLLVISLVVGLLTVTSLLLAWRGVNMVRHTSERELDLVASVLLADVRNVLLSSSADASLTWQHDVKSYDGIRGVGLYLADGKRIFTYRNPGVGRVEVPEQISSAMSVTCMVGCGKAYAVAHGQDVLGHLWLEIDSCGHPVRFLPVVLVILLVASLILLITAVLLSRLETQVEQPISRLAGTVQDICERKDFSLRVASERSGGSMDGLTASVNLLLDEIVSREKDMVSLLDRLESRVETRTAALQEINTRLRHEKTRADNAATVKSDFLANMSHEIRTPMNGIIAACDLATEEEVSPKVGNYLKIIQESSHALLLVVRDILDFSRLEAGNLPLDVKTFRLSDLANGVEDTFRHKAMQEHLDFVVSCEGDVPDLLVGDIGRLRQIVDNLVDNGLKFTKSGSVTTKFSCRDKGDDEVELIIKVTDTGIGLPKSSIYRIFDAFHQEDSSMTREFGGTGLGLAISKRLAKMMGGTITVEGEAGKGCVFTVQVRLGWQAEQVAEGVKAPLPSRALADTALDLSGLHILVVEDNEINRGIAEAMLTGMGVTVDTAVNGKLGVDKVALHSYDAVLMDMQMPVMDGYNAIAKIRAMEKGGSLPIIALTAHALEHDRERCLQAGADDYVSKPVNKKHVEQVLARFFGEEKGTISSPVPQVPTGEAGVAQHYSSTIDPQGAMVRLGVEEDVYRRVVETFCLDYHTFDGRLAKALDDRDVKAVQTLVHSLKGSSGTVGADALAERARKMEEGCKSGTLPAPEQIGLLLADLAEVIQGLGFYQGEGGMPKEEQGDIVVVDQQKVVGILHELADSLDQSMYDNINAAFRELEVNLVSPDVATLDQMIRMYQYEEAHSLVEKIIEGLSLEA